MIDSIKTDAKTRMNKSMEALRVAFAKIRTGRASPSLLDSVRVDCYGASTPLSQMANVSVEEGRVLVVRVWDRSSLPDVEKAIHKSSLGLNPSTAGEVIRVPLPDLTEETRKEYVRQARAEAEQARIGIRQIRRDALAEVKDLKKNKEISEDDERRAETQIQQLTDSIIAEVDKTLSDKEQDLRAI